MVREKQVGAERRSSKDDFLSALETAPGQELLKRLALDFGLVRKHNWLGDESSRRELIEAVITLRKYIHRLGALDAVFIETSSRPIALMLKEIDTLRMSASRACAERAASTFYPMMDSTVDESRLRARRHVPPGSLRDIMLNGLRDPGRLRIYNMSTPDAFDLTDGIPLTGTVEEKMAAGWMPEYAILRERAPDLFTLLVLNKREVVFVDDFVETGDTMCEMRDFIRRVRWVHQQLGGDGKNWRRDPALYEKVKKLWYESRNHVHEVKLSNIHFASLFGHERFEMPDFVFIAKKRLSPPPWHPSTHFRDDDGEYKQVHCSLEAVVQRHGYPWGTPNNEVGRRNEYVVQGAHGPRKHVIGMPYSPAETPILPARNSNLALALEMAYPWRVCQVIAAENAKRRFEEERQPMHAKLTVSFVRRLKEDRAFAKEKIAQCKIGMPGHEAEILGQIGETEPEALMRALETLNRRPAELETEIRLLVQQNADRVFGELGQKEATISELRKLFKAARQRLRQE